MTQTEWLVTLAGALTIAWINWYFFFAGRSAAAAVASADGVQEVLITVRGGYDPADVRVRSGAPVRLVFDRQETSGGSEEVVLVDFGIRWVLSAHQETEGEFSPGRVGNCELICGLDM